jgi:hypothetical protein
MPYVKEAAMQTQSVSSTNGHPAPPPARAEVPASVDDLLALAPDALARLYQEASVPDLSRIDGDLKGRMLAWQGLRGPAAGLIRAAASWDRFPWRGKSFHPRGAGAGVGVNRVVSDRWKLFEFTTFVGPSRAGDFDAVQLDYDHPGNPFFIRAIKDEIRELKPGLFLGQAWLQLKDKEHLVLYFGLQMP